MPVELPPTVTLEERSARNARLHRAAMEKLAVSMVSFEEGFKAGKEKAMPVYFWAGVKIGGLCCGLLCLAVGVAGGMFWAALGVASR